MKPRGQCIICGAVLPWDRKVICGSPKCRAERRKQIQAAVVVPPEVVKEILREFESGKIELGNGFIARRERLSEIVGRRAAELSISPNRLLDAVQSARR